MKIGIYARGLSEKSGGTKRMIYEFTRRLINILPDDDELYIFHNCQGNVFSSDKKNVHEIIIKTKSKLLCDYILGPHEIRKKRLDSVWISKTLIPIVYGCKTTVSITDLSSFYPKFNSHPFFLRLYMNFIKIFSAKFSDKVHSISESTKKDIVKFTRIKSSKIKTIYLAADDSFYVFKDKEKLEKIRKKYSLPQKFLLFFGMISPRKNVKNLIIAFKNLNPDYDLILAGGKGWNNSEEYKLIENSRNIRHIGKVDEEDMAGVYSLATAFVFPSFYEGFGLPIIEAQRCGCPVICSNTNPLVEIGKESTLYFDPHNLSEIAKKIDLIMADSKLRGKLKKLGDENAKRFDWDKSSEELLNFIR